MKQDDLHVVQDEWVYTATKSAARSKIKRTRSKAKRRLSKKLITQALASENE